MKEESLAKKLQNPAIYPGSPREIELVQTHISYVFLTGQFVYKVKKPVNFGFLDYSTLEKRRFYCQEEVRLNRRLCLDIYLGVVEIKKDKDKLSVGGRGKVIEYSVKMRQLPQERMMDNLIKSGLVTKKMLGEVASKVADFHSRAETSPEIDQYGQSLQVKKNIDENFDQTKDFIDVALAEKRYDEIKHYSYRFLEEQEDLINRRIREGRVRDCHGDLYSRNICFVDDEVFIYDCIEFNKRFRYSDVAAEVAFLAMDLDFYGREDLSTYFVDSYVKYSQDVELLKLLDFYKCYRAYVRGKVHCFSLPSREVSSGEEELMEDKRTVHLSLARKYFQLAHRYSGGKSRPALVAVGGLIGTGKTSVASYLKDKFHLPVINSDVVRKRLSGIATSEPRHEKFSEGIYSEQFTEKVYNVMFEGAKGYLEMGRSVVLDATFSSRKNRQKASGVAQASGADFAFIECVCDEEEVKKRLAYRLKHKKAASDGRWEIYTELKKNFDDVDEISPKNHMVIDTSKPFLSNLSDVLTNL